MIDKGQPILRFAPSPNGELHLGHAYSALINRNMADALGGKLLLRIEDIDTARCTPALERQMLADLQWLGIEFDTTDGEPHRRQSEHFADYEEALAHLRDAGLVYPAFMSRSEIRLYVERFEQDGNIWPRDPDGSPHYPGEETLLSPDELRAQINDNPRFAWRLHMKAAMAHVGDQLQWLEYDGKMERQQQAMPEKWGDVVLARSDTPTSYHMAVVADDALQGVTHVVRGHDLFEATAVHRLLQELLGLPAPHYHHHALILADDGRKLSKSNRDTSLKSLRQAGASPADIRRMVGLA